MFSIVLRKNGLIEIPDYHNGCVHGTANCNHPCTGASKKSGHGDQGQVFGFSEGHILYVTLAEQGLREGKG